MVGRREAGCSGRRDEDHHLPGVFELASVREELVDDALLRLGGEAMLEVRSDRHGDERLPLRELVERVFALRFRRPHRTEEDEGDRADHERVEPEALHSSHFASVFLSIPSFSQAAVLLPPTRSSTHAA